MPNEDRGKEEKAFDKFYSDYPEKRMERRVDIYTTVANMKDDQGDLRIEYDQLMRKLYGDPRDDDDYGKFRQINDNTKRIKKLEKLELIIYSAFVPVLYLIYQFINMLVELFSKGGG